MTHAPIRSNNLATFKHGTSMKRKSALLASVISAALAFPAMAADPDLIVFDWAGFEIES